MRWTLQLLAAVGCLAFATDAVAEEARPTLGFGFGTVLGSSATDPVDTANVSIVVPIGFGKVRVEPEFRLDAVKLRFGDDRGATQMTGVVGVGALYEVGRTVRTSAYAGGRIGLIYARDTVWDISRFGGWGALVLGGEYFPAPLVSVGAEVRVGFEAPPSPDGAYYKSTATTSGLAFVRFYVR